MGAPCPLGGMLQYERTGFKKEPLMIKGACPGRGLWLEKGGGLWCRIGLPNSCYPNRMGYGTSPSKSGPQGGGEENVSLARVGLAMPYLSEMVPA